MILSVLMYEGFNAPMIFRWSISLVTIMTFIISIVVFFLHIFSEYEENISEFQVKCLRFFALFLAAIGIVSFLIDMSTMLIKVGIAGHSILDSSAGPIGEALIQVWVGFALALFVMLLKLISEWKNIHSIKKSKRASQSPV